eukprot:1278170-Rhodomonas_salina.4
MQRHFTPSTRHVFGGGGGGGGGGNSGVVVDDDHDHDRVVVDDDHDHDRDHDVMMCFGCALVCVLCMGASAVCDHAPGFCLGVVVVVGVGVRGREVRPLQARAKTMRQNTSCHKNHGKENEKNMTRIREAENLLPSKAAERAKLRVRRILLLLLLRRWRRVVTQRQGHRSLLSKGSEAPLPETVRSMADERSAPDAKESERERDKAGDNAREIKLVASNKG